MVDPGRRVRPAADRGGRGHRPPADVGPARFGQPEDPRDGPHRQGLGEGGQEVQLGTVGQGRGEFFGRLADQWFHPGQGAGREGALHQLAQPGVVGCVTGAERGDVGPALGPDPGHLVGHLGRRLGVLVHPGGEAPGIAQHLAGGLGVGDQVPAVPGQVVDRAGPAQPLVDRWRVGLEAGTEQVQVGGAGRGVGPHLRTQHLQTPDRGAEAGPPRPGPWHPGRSCAWPGTRTAIRRACARTRRRSARGATCHPPARAG